MQTDGSKPAIASIAGTNHILKKYGFAIKKSLGQNFMIDDRILDLMVQASGLDETRGVLEIGPGLGALTEKLAEAAGKVMAIELDRRLIPILQDVLRAHTNVTVVEGDFLKTDASDSAFKLFMESGSFSVVANLPYYITTPIVMKLLQEQWPVENIVVMVQKEVAERMTAKPGGKEYGSLSIAVQFHSLPEMVTIVPREAFIPRPNVESAVIKLARRTKAPVDLIDQDYFFEVVRACFVQRRKTIWNNLLVFTGARGMEREQLSTILAKCRIDPVRRGETLSIEEYALLSNHLYSETRFDTDKVNKV